MTSAFLYNGQGRSPIWCSPFQPVITSSWYRIHQRTLNFVQRSHMLLILRISLSIVFCNPLQKLFFSMSNTFIDGKGVIKSLVLLNQHIEFRLILKFVTALNLNRGVMIGNTVEIIARLCYCCLLKQGTQRYPDHARLPVYDLFFRIFPRHLRLMFEWIPDKLLFISKVLCLVYVPLLFPYPSQNGPFPRRFRQTTPHSRWYLLFSHVLINHFASPLQLIN